MKHFPNVATSQAWSAMGWNDFAATYNAILTSGSSVAMRMGRFHRTVEETLASVGFVRNNFYSMGIEDAMLTRNRKAVLIPPVQDYLEHRSVTMPVPTPCDCCGTVQDDLLLCDGGLLSDYACSVHCLKTLRESVIACDAFLSELFRMHPRRQAVPLPEDEGEMILHFANVPSCSARSLLSDEYQDELNVYLAKKRDKVAIEMIQ